MRNATQYICANVRVANKAGHFWRALRQESALMSYYLKYFVCVNRWYFLYKLSKISRVSKILCPEKRIVLCG